MYLLDTDILTLLLHNQAKVVERVRGLREPKPIATTVITRYEILRGRYETLLKAATKSEWLLAQSRLDLVEAALTAIATIRVDEAAADHFERLRNLKPIKRIGRADLLIASIALAHEATSVTRNLKDFHHIPDLKLENWAD